MSNLLEHFSDRSRMIIFLTRMDAGKRGASAIEPGDLLEALIHEDQGELARRFAGSVTQSGPIRAPEPFFSAAAASEILLKLHNILPQNKPVADSVDMPMSPTLGEILKRATELAMELQDKQVQPLHLVAGILAQESSEPAEILKEAGMTRETLIQALQS